jgi:saccharopine dehydrogenase-like NADP-dependent oxidoreductase
MGRAAAKTAVDFKEIAAMTIADLDGDAAKAAADQCGPKAGSCAISVLDRAALVALMRQHDGVLNCVGPFFRFAVPVLTSAIEAGVHYFDICDDPEPTRDMLDLGKEAEKAGITAVVGLGATPGITNMLAQKIHGMLTSTEELHAAWNIEEKTAEGTNKLEYSAAIVHWMKQCSGRILERRSGELTPVGPLREVMLDYPGRGTRKVWTVGHPEPVSFSWSYPEIRNSSCYMVMPGLAADYFQKLSEQIDRGALTLEEAGHKLIEWSQEDSLIERGIAALYSLFEGPRLPLLFALAKGEREGKRMTIAATLKAMPRDMATMTGVPLAIGLHQFAEGRIAKKGVLTPEIALDGDRFFAELAPFCIYPREVREEELLDITEEEG